jgi:hypothetical protein
MICLVPMVEQKRFVDVEGGDAAVFAAVLVDGVGDEAAPSSRLSKSTLRDPTPFRLADACCFVLIFRVSSFGGCWRDCCTVLPIFLFHFIANWNFFKNVAFPISLPPPPPTLFYDAILKLFKIKFLYRRTVARRNPLVLWLLLPHVTRSITVCKLGLNPDF